MTRPDSLHVSLQETSHQAEIADKIQELVSGTLVRETEPEIVQILSDCF